MNSQDNNSDVTVEELLRQVPAVKESASCSSVLDLFHRDRDLYALPVVDDKLRPIGMVVRQEVTETFSKPYFKELIGEKSVAEMMDRNPIIVDSGTAIEDVARIILDAGIEYMVSGFIVTSNGRYLGMGNGYDLINEIMSHRQKHLFGLAHFDQLTELPNRTLLLDRLEQALSVSSRSQRKISLLFIDLDGFKPVNDTYGHHTGDRLLKEVATRLQACIRDGDTAARLGGDEFVVMLPESDVELAAMVAQRILDKLRLPYALGVNNVDGLSGSVGIAAYPEHAGSLDDLLHAADQAMYAAKKAGKDRFAVFAAS